MRPNQRSCFIGNVVKLVFRLFSVFGNDDGDGVAGDGANAQAALTEGETPLPQFQLTGDDYKQR